MADEVFEQTFNDLWQETSVSTVIDARAKNKVSLSRSEQRPAKPALTVRNDFEKVEAAQILDCGCQTSIIEDSEEVVNLKTKVNHNL